MLHTSVTYPTMLCAQRPHQSTRVTKIFQWVLPSLRLPLFKEGNLGVRNQASCNNRQTTCSKKATECSRMQTSCISQFWATTTRTIFCVHTGLVITKPFIVKLFTRVNFAMFLLRFYAVGSLVRSWLPRLHVQFLPQSGATVLWMNDGWGRYDRSRAIW